MSVALVSYDITNWSIPSTEIDKALANSGLQFADAIVEEGYRAIYNLESNCGNPKGLKCLYLYLYFLQYYKINSTTSLVPEETVIQVLNNIEQISKSCCNGL